MLSLNIRPAQPEDVPALVELYYNTIITVNAHDYNAEQIEAWASTAWRVDSLNRRITDQYFIVAELNKTITGFASLDDTGYLDLMYVHKDYQRQGVATALFDTLMQRTEVLALPEIWVDASITARPFFEAKGFSVCRQQHVIVRGVELINFKMNKVISHNPTSSTSSI